MGFLKRRGRSLFIVFSVLVILAGAAVIYFSSLEPVQEKEPVDVMRSFSFSSPDQLEKWEEKKLSRNSTKYTIVNYADGPCLRGYSENSASALYIRETLSPDFGPYIKWDWKVIKFPDRQSQESLDEKEEFDFAMQVYVIFYARSMLAARAIQYVWTEDIPAGSVADSPYTKNVKIMVLQSGEAEVWHREERDIAQDYLELFGEELDRDIMAVSFMSDSDSTGTTAEALIKNIELGYLFLERADIESDAEESAPVSDFK
jgi:hypothetical protein